MTPSIEVYQDEILTYDSMLKGCTKSSGVKATGPEFSKKLIGEALATHISNIDHEVCEAGEEDSFFVVDLGEVYRSYMKWKETLPNVHAYYAVKCNTDLSVIKLLGQLGANFDCASKNEIDIVLGLGFSPDRIVYANPCKTNSYIRYANDSNVNLTTVDNPQELYKLHKYHPECGILLRIATDDETAQCRLSTKFGCSVDTAVNELLPLASKLGLNVRGVAFHVGSGAKDFDSIHKAVKDSRFIFDKGIDEYGYGKTMNVLDIGGGFEMETFDKSSAMVKLSLEKYFSSDYCSSQNIKFIAEPGRLMVSKAFTLAAHIIARRDLPKSLKESNNLEAMLYINDGVYGNMNCILFDHQNPVPHVLTHKNGLYYNEQESGRTTKHQFSIWGPTCDGLDCVSNRSALYHNVEVGDWLYFPDLGAYTSAATTSFNGFKNKAQVIRVASEDFSELDL